MPDFSIGIGHSQSGLLRTICALLLSLTALLAVASPASAQSDQAPTITLSVDATSLPKKLATAHLTIAVEPGPLVLHYVKWTPGNHSPSGPIQNLVDLVIRDCNGQPLNWLRDESEPTRLTLTVPAQCTHIDIDLAYIADQPSVISRSTDTYGRATFGVLNWNTVLLYPDGFTHQQITVAPSLTVPAHWSVATSLPAHDPATLEAASADDVTDPNPRHIGFTTVTLAQLIDSPVIMGTYMQSYALDVPRIPRHVMHLVADDPALIEMPGFLLPKFVALVEQSVAIFAPPRKQSFPRDRYHFLIALGDGLSFGVEHATCTLIGMAPTRIISAKESETTGGGQAIGVIPHEYFHTWCAKLAAPRALITSDYHTTPGRDLLWVYEGLTTYYTGILSVRSGLTTLDEYRQSLRDSAANYEFRSGRLWRPVTDTARSVQDLRPRTKAWASRREGLEYYGQGAMFWLEADALIRTGTRGRRSINSFCRLLFDVPPRPVGTQGTYDRSDIVRALRKTYEKVDWDALIRDRLERPHSTLDMDPLFEKLGYRLTYASEATTDQEQSIAQDKGADLRTSLGIRVDEHAVITEVVPGSAADQSGLAHAMALIAVNSMAYTPQRLRTAVEHSTARGHIKLIVRFGESIQPLDVPYSSGGRYPTLKHIPGRRDLIKTIAEPLRFAPAR